MCNITVKKFMAPRDKTGDLWQVVVVSSRRYGDFDLPQLTEFAQFSLKCVQISFFECSVLLTEIFGLKGSKSPNYSYL